MKVILFRSRLRGGVDPEAYDRHAAALYEIVSQIPGFVSAEDFVGESGDRLAVIVFQDDESLRVWREHPVHRAAQERGRREYYAFYNIQICSLDRESSFSV
jgi:heme-degrading monooxygenase HmoA